VAKCACCPMRATGKVVIKGKNIQLCDVHTGMMQVHVDAENGRKEKARALLEHGRYCPSCSKPMLDRNGKCACGWGGNESVESGSPVR